MNVYMLMAAAILILALLLGGNIPQNKKFIVLACIIMFAVYGLRDTYSVGNDSSSSYLVAFEKMGDVTWEQIFKDAEYNDNVLWSSLTKIGFSLLDGDYQLFITLISAFVITVLGRFVYRYSASPVQSFIYYWGLWFFTFNFSALKQSIAMSLILLAFDAVVDRKLIKFLFMTGIAALFHFPAIIFLPSYAIAKLNLRKGFLIVLALLFVSVYFWRDQILDYAVQFYYENRTFEGEDRFLTGKVTVMLLLVLTAYFLRPPQKQDRVYSISLQLVALSTVIQLFSVYNNVFERLADYYFQFSVIFVPFILDRGRTRKEGKTHSGRGLAISIAPFILGVMCLYRFNDIVTREASMLLPYKFFFQSEHVVQDLLQIHWPLL